MPQMSSMFWLILMFVFVFMMFLFCVILYYVSPMSNLNLSFNSNNLMFKMEF